MEFRRITLNDLHEFDETPDFAACSLRERGIMQGRQY